MNEVTLLHDYLFVGAMLFSIGLVGFLCRRNMIIMFLCAEMMLQGVSISLVGWSRFHNNWDGQILTIFILTVAACEAGIALALVLMLYERSGNLDIAFWQNNREANQPAYVDEKLPDEPETKAKWPSLTPAGIEPETSEEEVSYRTHV